MRAGTTAPGLGLVWHEEYPMTETLDALEMLVAAHQATGWSMESAPPWWLSEIVVARVVVGDVGFHGPPPTTGPLEVEIGYNVVPGLRRRGVATQACRLILTQAWSDGATSVTAETEGHNLASQLVLLHSGFTDLGGFRYRAERPAEVGG